MENIVLVHGNYICFAKALHTSLANGTELPIEYFMTKLGLVIPMSAKSLAPFTYQGLCYHNQNDDRGIIEYFDEKEAMKNAHSLLLTKSKRFIVCTEFKLDPFKFKPNEIQHGPGIKWSLASEIETHDVAHTAIELANSIDEAFSNFYKLYPTYYGNYYQIYLIDELINWVDRCLEIDNVVKFEGTIFTPSILSEECNVVKKINV
jgi:hypothetical protein